VETFNSGAFLMGTNFWLRELRSEGGQRELISNNFFWNNKDYAPTFPVYQDYLTSKHSQLTVEVVVLNLIAQHLFLVEYTFGYKNIEPIIRKGKIQFEGSNCFFSTSWSNDINHNLIKKYIGLQLQKSTDESYSHINSLTNTSYKNKGELCWNPVQLRDKDEQKKRRSFCWKKFLWKLLA